VFVSGSVLVAHVVQPLHLGCTRRGEGAGPGQVLEQVVGGMMLDGQAKVLVTVEAVDVEHADLSEPDPGAGGGVLIAGQPARVGVQQGAPPGRNRAAGGLRVFRVHAGLLVVSPDVGIVVDGPDAGPQAVQVVHVDG